MRRCTTPLKSLFWLWICLHCTYCFCPNNHPWTLQNALPTIVVILHNMASHQGTHFTDREVWQWPYSHRIHWPYHVSHHPEAACLIKWWTSLLKTQLQHQLSGSILEGWKKILQKAVCTLNICQINAIISPIVNMHGSRNQGGGGKGTGFIRYHPTGPLGKFFFKFCLPRSFGSRWKSTPAWRYNKHSIELEDQIPPVTLGFWCP